MNDRNGKYEVIRETEATQSLGAFGLSMGAGCTVRFSSLPSHTPAGKAILAKALTGSRIVLWDALPVTLAVEHVLFLEEGFVDEETGETGTRGKTLVVTPDGEVYATGSRPCFTALSRIAAVLGNPPWEPALVIDFTKVKSSGQRTYMTCQLHIDGSSDGVPGSEVPNVGSRKRRGG